MSRFRLAALDLDGTLVDSAPDLARCLGWALAEAGFEPPALASVRQWIGDGVESLIVRGLAAALGSVPDASLVQTTLACFDRCYGEHLFTDSTLYPGVMETLNALTDAGLELACVTNKRERYAIRLLEMAGLMPRLGFVCGGDTFTAKKPDPEPLLQTCRAMGVSAGATVMVGDSVNDCAAASAAGSAFVYAAYGYVPADDAVLRRGFGVIENFAGLRTLLCGDRARK